MERRRDAGFAAALDVRSITLASVGAALQGGPLHKNINTEDTVRFLKSLTAEDTENTEAALATL